MPRRRRTTPGGFVYHVLNRGVGRMRLFANGFDYAAFVGIISETLARYPMRICGYVVMPNHWHLVLWPEGDDDLSPFVQRLTTTHALRWQKHDSSVGDGHVYQGRFKSFPVETDEHFYRVLRYVERNPLRSNLDTRAETWRWSSCWARQFGTPDDKKLLGPLPIDLPTDWTDLVNQPQTEAEVEALRRCIECSQPFGNEGWVRETAASLGLDSTLRGRGRPKRT